MTTTFTHEETHGALLRQLALATDESHGVISLPDGMIPSGLRVERVEQGFLSGAAQQAAWEVLVPFLLDTFPDDCEVVERRRAELGNVLAESSLSLLAVRPFDQDGLATEAFRLLMAWTRSNSRASHPGVLEVLPLAGELREAVDLRTLELKVREIHRCVEKRASRHLRLSVDLPEDWVEQMVHTLKNRRTDQVPYTTDGVTRWTTDSHWPARHALPVYRWDDRYLDQWSLEAAARVCGFME